jgi:hypothetical protein
MHATESNGQNQLRNSDRYICDYCKRLSGRIKTTVQRFLCDFAYHKSSAVKIGYCGMFRAGVVLDQADPAVLNVIETVL